MDAAESILNPYVYKSLLVLLMAIAGIWKAVPLGLVLKLHPVLIFVMTAIGGNITVLVLFYSGNKLKSLLFKHREKREQSRSAKRVRYLLDKYGPAGLGLIGTLLAGQITTVLLGLALVRSQRAFLWWAMAGTVFASLVITVVLVSGVDLIDWISQNIKLS